MSLGRQDFEQEAKRLVADKSWKGHLTLGIIVIIVGGLVSSPVFTMIRALLELLLVVGGLFLIGWAIYQYIQAQEKV
jgi:uncharacterized membrane protein